MIFPSRPRHSSSSLHFMCAYSEVLVPTTSSGAQRNFLATRGACQSERQQEVSTATTLAGSLPNEFYASLSSSASGNDVTHSNSSLRASQSQSLMMGSRNRGVPQTTLEMGTSASPVPAREGGTDVSASRGLMLGGARTARRSSALFDVK